MGVWSGRGGDRVDVNENVKNVRGWESGRGWRSSLGAWEGEVIVKMQKSRGWVFGWGSGRGWSRGGFGRGGPGGGGSVGGSGWGSGWL